MESKRSYEKLLVVLIDLYVADVDEEEDQELANLVLELNGEPISRINELKHRGNYLFKKTQFINAANLYEQAIKLLCFLGPVEKNAELVCWNLAISLSLNLAACALKLHLYNEARASCSLVLNFEPGNVKALYRRALALSNLNLHKEAYDDLKLGLEGDPNNKDIIRELNMVENKLFVNSNGKRCSNDGKSNMGDKKSKKTASIKDTECLELNTNVAGNEKEDSPIEVELACCPHQKPEYSLEDLSHNNNICDGFAEEMDESRDGSIYEFSKRKGGLSRLKIPVSVYDSIKKGEQVSFYNYSSQSYMKVRAIHPMTTSFKDSHKSNEVRNIQHFEMETISEPAANSDHMIEDLYLARSEVLVTPTPSFQHYEGTDRGSSLVHMSTDVVSLACAHPSFGSSEPSTESHGGLQSQSLVSGRSTDACYSTKLPNSRLHVTLDPSSKTRLRILRFRCSRDFYVGRQNKNTYSSSRFPSLWKMNVNFPRPNGVSLYYSVHTPISTKRKSTYVPELMYPCVVPAKKLCLGLSRANSSQEKDTTSERIQVLNLMSDFTKENGAYLGENITTRENLSFLVGQEGSCTMLQIWVDVAWKSDQRAAVGWVVMDNNVEVEVEATNLKCQNPIQAEVIGIRNVIAWAVEQGFLHIIIYMDCLSFVLQVNEDANMDHNFKSLVKDVIGESGIEHSIGNVIKDIWALAANFHCLAITYVPRSENKRAYRLAKKALNNCTM